VSSGIGSVVPILHDLQEAVRAVRP
jgi:hypothetical protein